MLQFLKNKSLKVLAVGLLAGMLVIFLAEFLVIRGRIEVLEEIEEKKDYARSAQIDGQQLSYLVALQTGGQDHSAALLEKVTELNHKLDILGKGGRIDESNVFLKPLSRLPAITFKNLHESWQGYRNSTLALLDGKEVAPVTVIDTTAVADSLATNAITPPAIAVETLLAGQWLQLSTWFERLLVDLTEEAEAKKASVENWFLFFVLFDVLLLASLFYFFYRFVLLPMRLLKKNIVGRVQDFSFAQNEVGELSQEVNEVIEQLQDATEFVAAIGEGKLDFSYQSLDENYVAGKNRLADSLISMQQKLRSLNEEEQKRQWANEGLAKFVDILRTSNDNINTLADRIISGLVKYTNANQGGLYVLNDEDEHNRHLELVSMFAFDSKKFEKQKVKLGEGILGQTFLEKETTVLNEIPDTYIRITSGLGGANPRALLMVPLKVDKEVYGIVELASFNNFQQHEIAFVEKLAETIASTLASVKIAQKNKLLIEQFQQQTEEMRSQEEEMRQNMEELQATQEELSRKEQDYIQRIRELETALKETISAEDHERVSQEFRQREQSFHSKVRDLETKLAARPQRAEDWELAGEMEKLFRTQMEGLRIAQEEFDKKHRH